MPNSNPIHPACVVFDLGKVLVDFDYSICARRIAEAGTLSFDQVQDYLKQAPLFVRYELGEVNSTQFYQSLCQDTGFNGTEAEFATCFADIFFPIPKMIALRDQLQARGYATYIFSNTNELAVNHIRRSFPFFSRFNGYVLSYEHGAMKPDPRLYEVVEAMTGQAGPALLYLDDLADNIASGRQRGWQTIHHQSTDQTLRTVQELGLLNPS